ncbi:MAG: T9SS C-terminal target domain-containing protein [Saprospirales bacterium]|nr:MAG: T9SS C-terminal target domain-containing protein [Saprospirales bacterium]
MIKLFTIFTILCFSWSITAQITLDAENVIHQPDLLDVRSVAVGSIMVPEAGENNLYDYSNLNIVGIDTFIYFPADDPNFSNAIRYFTGSPSLGPISLTSDYYSGMSVEGKFNLGSYLRPQKETLVAFTGNLNDSINFTGTYSVFEEPDYLLKFPTTYGDSWSNRFVFNTETEITVNAFFLNEAPVLNKQICEREVQVVGWGEIILPLPEGGISAPYEVLLVRDQLTYLDSFFLGDDPAPLMLLDAFSLQQGGISSSNSYHFYGEGFDQPIFTIHMDSDFRQPLFASVRNSDLLSSVGETFARAETRVFPNPVGEKQSVKIEFEDGFQPTVLILMDLSGREVYRLSSPEFFGNLLSFDLPPHLSSGIYFYHMRDEKNILEGNGKIIVE